MQLSRYLGIELLRYRSAVTISKMQKHSFFRSYRCHKIHEYDVIVTSQDFFFLKIWWIWIEGTTTYT